MQHMHIDRGGGVTYPLEFKEIYQGGFEIDPHNKKLLSFFLKSNQLIH